LTILVYVALALIIVVCAVPYLMPLGELRSEVEVEDLVGENGRFLDIGGARIYVEEDNREAPLATVVFLHGLGGSTFSWRHNAPLFAARGYRVISLDMRGFGLSDKDFGSDYSHPAQAGLVADVLAELDVEKAYLVGHSMGTSVMLHFAHLYPEKVLGLISVAGAVSFRGSSAFPRAFLSFPPFRRAGAVFLTRYATKERIKGILESAYYQEAVAAGALDGYYNRIVNGKWAQALLAMTRDMDKNAINFALEDMAFPTLVFWGEEDTWVKRSDIDELKSRIPSAKLHIMPGTGHLPMEESPELFNALLLAFLEAYEH
jgi:pimeloyl-ACP methyl ester carboxylesterase